MAINTMVDISNVEYFADQKNTPYYVKSSKGGYGYSYEGLVNNFGKDFADQVASKYNTNTPTNSLGGSIADQQNTLIQDFVDQFGQQAYNDLVSNDLPFTTDNLNAGPQGPNDIVWNFPDTPTQQNLTDTQLFTNTSPNTIAGSNGQGYNSTQTTSNPSAVNSPSTSGGGQTNTPQTLSSGTLTSSNTAIDNKNKLAGILQTQGNAMLNNLLGSNQSQLDSALYNLNSQLADTGKLYTNPQNLYSTIASIQKRNRVTTDTTRVASRKYDMAIRQQPSLLG